MPVSEKEQQEINTLVRRFESDAGVEAVAAVVGKADAYPEIIWRAYAIGSVFGGLAVALLPYLFVDWSVAATAALTAMAILGAGALSATAAVFVPAVGRLFLDRLRAQAKIRQYALSLFVEREIFRTPDRCAVLAVVGRFERAAVMLADTGLCNHVSPAELERIADSMSRAARTRGVTAAFEHGFDTLRGVLRASGYSAAAPGANVLGDAVIADKGV